MIRILFQGDSITDGNRYKDPESRWDLNNQIGHSYVFLIAATLGRKAPGKYLFINRELSGDSVTSINARWQEDTLDEKPEVLSFFEIIKNPILTSGFHTNVITIILDKPVVCY